MLATIQTNPGSNKVGTNKQQQPPAAKSKGEMLQFKKKDQYLHFQSHANAQKTIENTRGTISLFEMINALLIPKIIVNKTA
jgi:hypothetical protein